MQHIERRCSPQGSVSKLSLNLTILVPDLCLGSHSWKLRLSVFAMTEVLWFHCIPCGLVVPSVCNRKKSSAAESVRDATEEMTGSLTITRPPCSLTSSFWCFHSFVLKRFDSFQYARPPVLTYADHTRRIFLSFEINLIRREPVRGHQPQPKVSAHEGRRTVKFQRPL